MRHVEDQGASRGRRSETPGGNVFLEAVFGSLGRLLLTVDADDQAAARHDNLVEQVTRSCCRRGGTYSSPVRNKVEPVAWAPSSGHCRRKSDQSRGKPTPRQLDQLGHEGGRGQVGHAAAIEFGYGAEVEAGQRPGRIDAGLGQPTAELRLITPLELVVRPHEPVVLASASSAMSKS